MSPDEKRKTVEFLEFALAEGKRARDRIQHRSVLYCGIHSLSLGGSRPLFADVERRGLFYMWAPVLAPGCECPVYRALTAACIFARAQA
jgi:hypothetical protein